MGGRDPLKAEAAARAAGQGSRFVSDDEVAAHGEVLWTVRETDQAAVLAKPAVLVGKVVIDLTTAITR